MEAAVSWGTQYTRTHTLTHIYIYIYIINIDITSTLTISIINVYKPDYVYIYESINTNYENCG